MSNGNVQTGLERVTGTISPLTALIVLACLGALTYLTAVGKVNGDATIALISAIVGGVLHGAGAASGAKAIVNPPPQE